MTDILLTLWARSLVDDFNVLLQQAGRGPQMTHAEMRVAIAPAILLLVHGVIALTGMDAIARPLTEAVWHTPLPDLTLASVRSYYCVIHLIISCQKKKKHWALDSTKKLIWYLPRRD